MFQRLKIVNAAKEHKAQIIGLSALMTTTMIKMEEVIKTGERRRLDRYKNHDRRRGGGSKLRRPDWRRRLRYRCHGISKAGKAFYRKIIPERNIPVAHGNAVGTTRILESFPVRHTRQLKLSI